MLQLEALLLLHGFRLLCLNRSLLLPESKFSATPVQDNVWSGMTCRQNATKDGFGRENARCKEDEFNGPKSGWVLEGTDQI